MRIHFAALLMCCGTIGSWSRSLHATTHATLLGHCLHSGHDVVWCLEVLKNAVLELSLLSGRELSGSMRFLKGALAANGHHGVHELGVALHSDSVVHIVKCVGPINLLLTLDYFLNVK